MQGTEPSKFKNNRVLTQKSDNYIAFLGSALPVIQ
jgi:hypothetical protein